MQTREATPNGATESSESLEHEVRVLRERLAFYEGFDLLIQENVAHSRELFRQAAQEREAASSATERARRDAWQREKCLRSELETVAAEIAEIALAVEAMTFRIARALGEQNAASAWAAPVSSSEGHPVAVVVHGVSSARSALSLQRFVASLPHVASVSAREFAGGVLRLDARVHDRLAVEHFETWEASRRKETLTERPDVIEFALGAVSG